MIILFDLRKLEDILVNDALPVQQRFSYFFIPVIYQALSEFKSIATNEDELFFLNMEHAFYALLSIIILYLLFRKTNRAGLGARFFEFYFSIRFVSFLRAALIFIPIAASFAILFAIFPYLYEPIEIYIDYLATALIVMTAYYFQWTSFNRVIERISNQINLYE